MRPEPEHTREYKPAPGVSLMGSGPPRRCLASFLFLQYTEILTAFDCACSKTWLVLEQPQLTGLKEPKMKTVLKIEGMTCEHCVKIVKEALEGVAGVKSATVKLKDKSASVNHGDEVGLASLKAAVTEAGYSC